MTIYVEHVREGLRELASEELQRRLWLNSGDPGVGSFEEAVCHIYDDSGLTDVLDRSVAAEELGRSAVELLRKLSVTLVTVEPRNVEVEDLINSPAMVSVRSLAGAALDALRTGS